MSIEICINSDNQLESVNDSVLKSYLAGAERIELCASMEFDGLTPDPEKTLMARKAFSYRKGLMVMIRPRKGDFIYTEREIELMKSQIKLAADNGADGVVFGVLDENAINMKRTYELVNLASKHNLKTTFHRAFDVVKDRKKAIKDLIDCGIDRVLTSGNDWQSNLSAMAGIDTINELIEIASGKIEIIIGGGVDVNNIQTLQNSIQNTNALISFHSYSGVLERGTVSQTKVEKMVSSVSTN